ncbi:hypothetical protein K7X08_006677 [Anisodus acutangulus]|uniref:Uncharacterized protein n=1 Tax=Anisodus acutangulus TaxID=402998 RepID=A0A9Q1MWF8_9SOLA|nr:hypothetical protein K7X08_006677 [Anisodus acutangulus]
MNHKTFSILFTVFFVLIFCLSSTTASRRLLSGGAGGNKMEMPSHTSKPAPSATEQSPPGIRGIGRKISYRSLQRPPICQERLYVSCTGTRNRSSDRRYKRPIQN